MQRAHLLSVVLLIAPTAALSQEAGLTPGQTVRITSHTYDLRRTPVTVVGVWTDSLQLQYTRKRLDHGIVVTDSLQSTVPLTAVTRLEIHGGRRSNWDKGARTGAIAGGFAGLLLGGVWAFSTCDPGMLCPETTGQRLSGLVSLGLTGGLAGGLVGAMIGAMSSRDAWQEVPIGNTRIGFLPHRDAFVVSASVRF